MDGARPLSFLGGFRVTVPACEVLASMGEPKSGRSVASECERNEARAPIGFQGAKRGRVVTRSWARWLITGSRLYKYGDETGLRQGFGANLWFQIRRKCVPSTRDFENKKSFDLENEIYLPFGG